MNATTVLPADRRSLLPPLPAGRSPSWLAALGQAFAEGRRGVTGYKLRSALTILGLVVAICGVLVVDTIGKGATTMLAGAFAAAGANLVSINSVAPTINGVQVGADTTLTEQDAQTVAKLPHVTALTVTMSLHMNAKSQVIAGNQNWSTVVLGVFPDAGAVQGATTAQGAFFTAQDEASGATVAVLGQKVAQNLFGGGPAVGQQIRIAPAPNPPNHGGGASAPVPSATVVTVVGVLRPQGAGLLGNDPDDVVYVPFSTAQQRLLGRGNGTFQSMYAQVDDQQNVAGAIAAATKAVEANHHLAPGKPDDFDVRNFAAAANEQSAAVRSVELVLSGITALALLIGGFGVANVMFASVVRRTREIGVRMAVGARREDVLRQFLLEAAVLSLLGGAIGIVVGYLVVIVLFHAMPMLASLGSLTSLLPGPGAVALAAGLSTATGIVFGYLPARRAARLDPVQALRQP